MSHHDDRTVGPAPSILTYELSGGIVLFDEAAGRAIGLDDHGAELWRLVAPGTTVETMVRTIGDRFVATPSTIRADIVEFVAGLADAGFVHVDP